MVETARAALGLCLLPKKGRGSRAERTLQTLASDLQKAIPQAISDAVVPGFSITIVHQGKLSWSRGFGVKNARSKEPVQEDTMFEAASLSKPVFAYAVMKLCEKGVLNLDIPLTKYISQRFVEGDSRLDLITARHVLSHSSGFQNWRSEADPLRIHFTPGTQFLYSGEGYSYLQKVVEHVTGQPLEDYIRANLFLPFGMSSSGYVWNDRLGAHMATPHDKDGDPMESRKSGPKDVARYGSSGALLTTPADYARFLTEILNPKPFDVFCLSKASLSEMLKPQVKEAETNEYSIWRGLGWRIARTKSGEVFNHGGENPGFQSFAEGSLDKKSGFVIMTNGQNGAQLLVKLAPSIASGLYSPTS